MNAEKADFLEHRFIPLLKKVPSSTCPLWGKMTFQQMVEHFSEMVRIASGKTSFAEIITTEPDLQRLRSWLLTDKPFKENTVNPLLPVVPAPVINTSIETAIAALETELRLFFSVFREKQLHLTRNPIFGDLNYDQNVQLLYKHALHHLKQFGVNP